MWRRSGMGTAVSALGRFRGYLAAVLALAVLAIAGCGGPPTPDAATLLKHAQAKFDQTKSFHFVLDAAHLGASDPLPVTHAIGDVQRPDQLSAKATVITQGFSFNVTLIIVGQREWISDPLTGQYRQTNDFGTLLTIFDAQQGVGAVLLHMQQPSAPQDSTVSDAPCWKVAGKVATSELASIVGGTVLPDATVATTVCIGKSDSELYLVTLSGAITSTDTPQTTRAFTLSQFDQPVMIQTPAA
jgi:hypothetical protein